MKIKSDLPNGIEVISSALLEVEKIKAGGATVKVRYMGTPKYEISVSAENYKIAEKVLETSNQKVKESIERKNGSFSFLREAPN